jgi:hypothetical protein
VSETQEWLVARLDHGHDLTWPVLIRRLARGICIHPLTPQLDCGGLLMRETACAVPPNRGC